MVSRLETFGTVVVTGAAVMIVEILGTRVIGPVFGVSLFVWAALLAVTLGALAAGYYGGGLLADRIPSGKTLNATVLTSGALLAIAPAVRSAVLAACSTLGPRVGPLVSATILFAPGLTALGSIGPIVARLTSADVRSTGRRVGTVFAVSTTGSLAGTFVAAFWLVPACETDHILLGTATLLALLGGVPLVFRNVPSAVVVASIPLALWFMPAPALPDGFVRLDRKQSIYGLVEVIDDKENHVRFMRVDHSVIGADLLPGHDSAFAFVYLLELARTLRPHATSMLQLGLGTGSLTRAIADPRLQTDVVELDPTVVAFAQKHFRFQPTGTVFTEDARTFLNTTKNRYDIIVHDTFTGGSTPEHLLSREVLARIRDILNPGGLLVLNFGGAVAGPGSRATELVGKTIRSVFPQVRGFRDDADAAVTNVVFFASLGDLTFENVDRARFQHAVREEVRRSLYHREFPIPRDVLGEIVITDARNPLNRLELTSAEAHAEAMNKLLPIAVWAN